MTDEYLMSVEGSVHFAKRCGILPLRGTIVVNHRERAPRFSKTYVANGVVVLWAIVDCLESPLPLEFRPSSDGRQTSLRAAVRRRSCECSPCLVRLRHRANETTRALPCSFSRDDPAAGRVETMVCRRFVCKQTLPPDPPTRGRLASACSSAFQRQVRL